MRPGGASVATLGAMRAPLPLRTVPTALRSAVLVAGALAGLAAASATVDEPPVVLPESRAARSFAGVGPETQPRALDEWLAAHAWLADPDASPDARWSGWATWLGAEAAAGEVDPARRAGLVALACRQGRWADAWAHHERLGGYPDWQAAVTPWILPGVPVDHGALAGGVAAPIEDGLLLRPGLLPEVLPGDDGRYPPRLARVNGVRIGDAVCDLVFEQERGGYTIDVYHRSGGEGLLRVDPPVPHGSKVFVDYVDWDRQDVKGGVLELAIAPREEEYTIYRRYKPRQDDFPAAPVTRPLPAAIRALGLRFRVPSEAERPEVRAFGAAVTALLDVPVVVELEPPGAPPGQDPAHALSIPAGPDGARLLARMASVVETYLLTAPPADEDAGATSPAAGGR